MEKNITLLSAASATGSVVKVQMGGDYCFAAAGTFGGASVGLDMLGPDNSTWIAVRDDVGVIAMTVAAAVIVSLPAGSYRSSITGGAGVSMSATLRSVD